MWGIIPAAGRGSRIQPLAFSKELLPVGCDINAGQETPRAVSEYLVERMLLAGADKLCFVIAPGKSDILEYYGGNRGDAAIAYVVQAAARGLCDAIFCAAPFVGPDEDVLIGLPDTIWFPKEALTALPRGDLSFLLFPVDQPQFFDAVLTDADDRVVEIQVKRPDASSHWVWGALRLTGSALHALEALWRLRGRCDEYLGTLVNAWIAQGGTALGLKAGRDYVDVGTLPGYRIAMSLLAPEHKQMDAS